MVLDCKTECLFVQQCISWAHCQVSSGYRIIKVFWTYTQRTTYTSASFSFSASIEYGWGFGLEFFGVGERGEVKHQKNYSGHLNMASFQAHNLYLISKHYVLCYLSKPLNTRLTVNALIISLLLFMENALDSACFCMTKFIFLFQVFHLYLFHTSNIWPTWNFTEANSDLLHYLRL